MSDQTATLAKVEQAAVAVAGARQQREQAATEDNLAAVQVVVAVL